MGDVVLFQTGQLFLLETEMMNIIHRYQQREIIKCMGIVLAAVVSIYVCVDFFEKIDNFMDAGVPPERVGLFFLYNIPFIIAQILPVCVLLSVLITFSLMIKRNEILALKSSGVSVYTLLRPALTIGICATIFLFLFSEWIAPITTRNANKIWLREVKKKSTVVSREKDLWIKDQRMIAYIRYFNHAHKTPYGLTLYYFDDAFHLVRRVDAKRGEFQGDRWLLYKAMEQTRVPGGEYEVEFHPALFAALNFKPEDLSSAMRASEEMGFQELLAYIKKVETEGYDATVYWVDLNGKIAFPFICVILSIVGAGISLRGNLREGMPVSVAYGLGVAFVYWVFYSFCISLGYGGLLPPLAAAWTANVIFFCFGAILLLNAE